MGLNEGAVSALSISQGAMNAAMTLAAVGAVAVAGSAVSRDVGVPVAADQPVVDVAGDATLVASTGYELSVLMKDSAPPADGHVEAESSASLDGHPRSSHAPPEESDATSVETSDVSPAETPGQAGASVIQNDEGMQVRNRGSIDLSGDGEDEASTNGTTALDCRSPEGSITMSTACAVEDELHEVTATAGL